MKNLGKVTKLINKKIIIAGDFIEVYDYDKGYFMDYEKHDKGGRGGQADEAEKQKNRELTLGRARSRIRRLINANVFEYYDRYNRAYKPVFCTLTFAENVQDISTANYEFEKFIKRLNYKVTGGSSKCNLKYLVVVEFQERGAIHYHVIFFNLPYIKQKDFGEIWGNGFTWIESIKSVKNVGAYVSKYLQKANDDERLRGKKCFFASRGLFEPEEITDKKIAEALERSLLPSEKIFESQFENEHIGKVNYRQYAIKKSNIKAYSMP